MRNLLLNPVSRKEDLGEAMPESEHAVSVAMPLIEHVHGYEEGRAEVLDKLKVGYPRFFLHRGLESYFRGLVAKEGEGCFCFPSQAVAKRAATYINTETRIERVEDDVWALFFPLASYSNV